MNIEQFFVIEVNEEICGFVQIYEHDGIVELIEIHLMPEMQGKGIGSDIIKELIEKANNENKTVRLGCCKENIRANKLYQKLGFIQTEETGTHFVFEWQ